MSLETVTIKWMQLCGLSFNVKISSLVNYKITLNLNLGALMGGLSKKSLLGLPRKLQLEVKSQRSVTQFGMRLMDLKMSRCK